MSPSMNECGDDARPRDGRICLKKKKKDKIKTAMVLNKANHLKPLVRKLQCNHGYSKVIHAALAAVASYAIHHRVHHVGVRVRVS